jgi:DNA-binding transcriptional ArsR family regulator
MSKRNGPGIELLADSTRRRLIAAISIRPRRPSSLAEEIGLSRPATTRQLHLLEEAGLIRATRSILDRRGIAFAIDPRSHGPITAWLAGTHVGRRLNLTIADATDPAD